MVVPCPVVVEVEGVVQTVSTVVAGVEQELKTKLTKISKSFVKNKIVFVFRRNE